MQRFDVVSKLCQINATTTPLAAGATFTVTNGDAFEEQPYGGLIVPAGADIQVRINSASANNLDVIAGYDLILIKN